MQVEDHWAVICNTLESEDAAQLAAAEKCAQELNEKVKTDKPVEKPKILAFKESERIAPYLFAVVGGPYEKFVNPPSEKFPPLRIWARKSLVGCVNAPEFFKVTMAGIEYYTEFFGQEFPFSKYDQVFAPEFNCGAMENVGCVTYNEGYLYRGQVPTRSQIDRFSITILHELAHQWFGNLVTMRWWDDLWLNESFATFMSILAQHYGKGLDDYTTGWLIFGGYKNWGINTDLLSTTHPVSTDCVHTDDAENIFDGISYGRGASFLKLLVFQIGEDALSAGMRIYFKRHAWGNTELPDFVRAL